jgi:hypothetical protein
MHRSCLDTGREGGNHRADPHFVISANTSSFPRRQESSARIDPSRRESAGYPNPAPSTALGCSSSSEDTG